MYGLPTFFRELVAAEPLPLAGFSAAAFQGRSARELTTIAQQAADLLGAGLGTALVEAGLHRAALPDPITPAYLRSQPAFEALLAGAHPLERGAKGEAVQLIQRLLMTLAARVPQAPVALRLPVWGADGVLGAETITAIEAARAHFNLACTGPMGAVDARGLLDALGRSPGPDWFARLPPEARVTAAARRITEIATAITEATEAAPFQTEIDGTAWSFHGPMFGVMAWADGHLRAPGGVSYGLSTRSDGYWKCNIFGGVVITLAGVPNAAFYWSTRHRTQHFPLAERFGPRLARLPGWRQVRHLDHRDPNDETQPLQGPAQQDELHALLREVLPGDLLFVDHPGDPGSNGGHTRVCVAAAEPDDPDAAPQFAQARHHAAAIEADGLSELGHGAELQFWLLRFEAPDEAPARR
jgi:peptidoglycan hydrolase-like protein with peptidoglycan-binding domain